MTKPTESNATSYADAGVDIAAGDALVQRIKPMVARTHRAGVLGGIGGFGGLFELPAGYRQPVLVSGADGVGTKLRLAIDHDQLDTVGIDLVAMCVNDILVSGAEPLWFLDYYASGRLNVDSASRVVSGIAHGCELAGAALLGGETAEMPGMYHGDDFDLAGFATGIVERANIIDGQAIKPGHTLVGLASSGPHSNGFSLIRMLIDKAQAAAADGAPAVPDTLIEQLLTPTRIYVKPVLALLQQVPVHGLAHITGGGLVDNLPRVLPAGCGVRLHTGSWQRPAVFDWLQQQSQLDDREFLRTFNAGIGMVVITPADAAQAAVDCLNSAGEQAMIIGTVTESGSTDGLADVLELQP